MHTVAFHWHRPEVPSSRQSRHPADVWRKLRNVWWGVCAPSPLRGRLGKGRARVGVGWRGAGGHLRAMCVKARLEVLRRADVAVEDGAVAAAGGEQVGAPGHAPDAAPVAVHGAHPAPAATHAHPEVFLAHQKRAPCSGATHMQKSLTRLAAVRTAWRRRLPVPFSCRQEQQTSGAGPQARRGGQAHSCDLLASQIWVWLLLVPMAR